MDKHKAIPQGYMTVGEVAKKMDVTVRTLQHYDREGLLSPSAMSEGGRRLYTDKDIVKLHQILSLKHLGFSLDDIKNRLIPLDTPAEIAAVLTEQAAAVKQKIDSLSESLRELEVLREEVLQMQSVDFKKYADLMNEKFFQLAEPEQLEEYLFTAVRPNRRFVSCGTCHRPCPFAGADTGRNFPLLLPAPAAARDRRTYRPDTQHSGAA